jgi:hypothetical protein
MEERLASEQNFYLVSSYAKRTGKLQPIKQQPDQFWKRDQYS